MGATLKKDLNFASINPDRRFVVKNLKPPLLLKKLPHIAKKRFVNTSLKTGLFEHYQQISQTDLLQ